MKGTYKFSNKPIHFLYFLLLLSITFLSQITPAHAQYFGQNKVRYKNLNFKVFQSPHFELYYYIKNDSLVKRFTKESELWYELHQQVFRDTFKTKNPLILYENAPDFQQTTAIEGDIGVGTGGVTEGMKNRVVMPLTLINQETRHVLGHELVHAFQYHSLIEGDSTNLENISKLPLWMVEGMAEYLSTGRNDAFTAMWMRDAYLNKDIPTLNDLTNSNKYFPYRYGQAFWSYIGSTYGDTVIVPFFKATARYGYQMAIRRTFGYDERTLSNLWRTSIENTYKPFLKDTAQVPIGKRIIDNKNGGENYNVAPAISPDGKYLTFLSEKDLFSIDLYLADAQTGRIIRKLISKARNEHLDELSFIESAGAWSPDSKQFAFGAFSQGRIKLFIVDVASGRNVLTEGMGDIGEFSNLAWSPDGQQIAFSGLKNGLSDLYLYNLKNKELTQLTDDHYSDFQPSFSNDGKTLVFATDREVLDQSTGSNITFNLALIDIATKHITNIDIFKGADNLNPQFSADNKQIYFLSDRDGFRNMYRYTLEGGKTEQLTDYFTGISGITKYSPALSISRNDDVLYSYYRAQKYSLYNAKTSEFKPIEVSPDSLDFTPALLPPGRIAGVDVINSNLDNFERFEKLHTDSIKTISYRPQFKLDYIANTGVGASVGGYYGAGLSGGIQGIFSDILGRNQIAAALAINGEIYDFGGQVAFINRKSRLNWGVGLSHIPYISAYTSSGFEDRSIGGTVENVYRSSYDIVRTFQDQLQLFTSFPFSRVHRFEIGTSYASYYYRFDRYSNFYTYQVDNNNNIYLTGSLGYDKRKISLDEANEFYTPAYGISFQQFRVGGLNAYFVGDNATNGITAPLEGFRYRVGAANYLGNYRFGTLTVDLRKYWRVKPVTIAVRSYNTNRFGRDQDRLYGEFIGYPMLVRGYEYNSLNKNGANSNFVNNLIGSKVSVANFEVRLPFTGPERLSALESKFLFSDLNFFFDAGVAYSSNSSIVFKGKNDVDNLAANQRAAIMSTGISLRVNLFGYFVIEPYYAIPFQRSDVSTGIFGVNIAPGW